MNYNMFLQVVLDIAEEMLVAGAEVNRVVDSINRICEAYGCDTERTNAFIITSNIQVTIVSPEDEIITQIRQVVRSETNFDRIDYLNDLSRYMCENTPDLDEVRRRFDGVLERPKHKPPVNFMGAAMVTGGFGVFFGGSIADGIAAMLVGLIIVASLRSLNKSQMNNLGTIFGASFVGGFVSLGLTLILPFLHVDKIMIGSIMILIPGLALTNAIRDLLVGDLATGLLRLINALMIAVCIAFGFAFPLLMMDKEYVLKMGLIASNWESFSEGAQWGIMALAGLIGASGYAIYTNVRKKQILYGGIGGMLAWVVYLLVSTFASGEFLPYFCAAFFVAVYAEIMAVINKAPTTIFLAASGITLVPGASLYYAMSGLIEKNTEMAMNGLNNCVVISLAISVGYILVSIIRNTIKKIS